MMRDLAISYGNSRQAKKWVNKTISFDALKERLKTTIRTTESAEEYAKMSKAQRDAAKDHGGFVGGTLKGGRRKIDTVELRSMIALDGDRIDKAFLDNYETTAPYTSVLYTTHSSTEDSPRVRIIFPMTRDVSSEEFVAVSRYVAQALGIDYFDECSYQPNQLMYWPSTPQNGVFVYKETDKEWLDPDDILSAHPEWTDPTQLPTSSRESKANTVTQQKVQDPLTKDGVVGLFNRVFFPVTKALEAFLSDVYEQTDNPNRWHLIESRSIAGVEIKDDKFVYSHHAKDPAYLKLCNAFDIVRIHRFGDDDEKASFRAMCDFAMQQEDVKLLAANERLAEAEADFVDAGDGDWKKRLKYQPRTSLLENSVYNLNLILANDPDFRNFAFNDMANRIQVTGPLPWERPKGNQFWRDADTAQLKSIIDIRYLPFSSRNHDVAFTKIADDRHFHPVRDYLDSLPAWDGVKRVEDLFIKYLKADDTEYVRAVTRKTFAAAVARIYVPGIKFDCVPVLDGDQGIGKSTIVKDLVTSEYYSETLSLTDMDDKSGAEKLQGFWVIEIGELAGMKKADTDGTTAAAFSPNLPCTRAQAVTFLWRAVGSPEPKTSSSVFTDVVAGSYYEKPVNWAVESDIVNGVSRTEFEPEGLCTRAQIVALLWRIQKKPSSHTTPLFRDVSANAYYAKAVCWALEKGITNGTAVQMFDPDAPCTRAQIVTFLYRCMNNGDR